jgi:hypothetical protein
MECNIGAYWSIVQDMTYAECYVGLASRIQLLFKELNPRRRVYVEIPKPSMVVLKCSQNPRGFWYINTDPTQRV